MHRLQAVAGIRQRAVHDGRERVSEVALLQRVAQHDLVDFGRLFGRKLSFSHKSKSFKSFPAVSQGF